jgi:pimeloyl-ACP methyl ester carboxylesterase
METPLRHGEVEVEPGVRLHFVEAGEGPLVLLLHGFPDFWYGWRNQIPALAAAGFRVVAPDQRGYDLSDKPARVSAYGIRTLASDVAALVDRLGGGERANVIGHDWGAGVAWAFAMAHPERLAKLAVLNGPHPQRLLAGLRNPVQLAKSWYMFFFQLPWLPEEVLRMDDFGLFTRAMRDEPTRAGAVTKEDLDRYLEAWNRPGALRGMVAWYRAMFLPSARVEMRTVEAPVLALWGDADPHLGAGLATPSSQLVPRARVVMIPGASHWVQHDAPERVNEELIGFLRAHG